MRAILFTAALLVSSCASAQLTVEHSPVGILPTGTTIKQVGDYLIVRSGETIAARPAVIIRVTTEADNVEVSVTDQARVPVEFIEASKTDYFLTKPGRYWVEVTAIDFAKNLYGRKTIVVEVGASPGPGPTPPDPDPPGPTPNPDPPDPPDDVPNEYGVGKVAFENAPRHQPTALKYAEIYRQAADFLYGVPSLKFIVSERESHSNDPNRSVIAWIQQQSALVQCPDTATCQQWANWRQAVSQALVESQRRRQYTRQDWWNALNEVSKSVGKVAQ